MSVGKKSALLMLVAVALWAALPVLACLMPAQQDDCCRQMIQQSGSCNMDAGQSCCQIRGSNSSVPLGGVSNPERSVTLAAMGAGLVVELPADRCSRSTRTLEAASSPPRIGSSVLRI